MVEFQAFKKIPRLSRDCVITEKIDGTNGVIYIGVDGEFLAGSHSRWLTPESDNFGFAKWVIKNKEELLKLGVGFHYGEWWGNGIQRNYGLKEKRFSLFNSGRWIKDKNILLLDKQEYCPACCDVVPILYTGIFDTNICGSFIDYLYFNGSKAAPGFMKPEGIVIYHRASNTMFKKTIENDEVPKTTIKSGTEFK